MDGIILVLSRDSRCWSLINLNLHFRLSEKLVWEWKILDWKKHWTILSSIYNIMRILKVLWMRQLSEGIQLLEVPHINLLVAFFVFDLYLFPKIVHWKSDFSHDEVLVWPFLTVSVTYNCYDMYPFLFMAVSTFDRLTLHVFPKSPDQKGTLMQLQKWIPKHICCHDNVSMAKWPS